MEATRVAGVRAAATEPTGANNRHSVQGCKGGKVRGKRQSDNKKIKEERGGCMNCKVDLYKRRLRDRNREWKKL